MTLEAAGTEWEVGFYLKHLHICLIVWWLCYFKPTAAIKVTFMKIPSQVKLLHKDFDFLIAQSRFPLPAIELRIGPLLSVFEQAHLELCLLKGLFHHWVFLLCCDCSFQPFTLQPNVSFIPCFQPFSCSSNLCEVHVRIKYLPIK